MTAVREALREAVRELRKSGIDNAALDARLLLGHALGREIWPHEDAVLDRRAGRAYAALVARRRRREPVSRILGRRGFWTLELAVTPATLDPRPDSESLIEAALSAFPEDAAPARILDLGTGTGCLLLAALVGFPAAAGLGVDRSPQAVAVARTNAANNALAARARFETADWACLAVAEPFDLVLCNPPYIAAGEIAALAPEVRDHDPMDALVAGDDGFAAYGELAGILRPLLSPAGRAILEIGIGQGDRVEAIMGAGGLRQVGRRHDLAGIERALILKCNDTHA